MREFGETMGVDKVLEGSVRRFDAELRMLLRSGLLSISSSIDFYGVIRWFFVIYISKYTY